MRQSPGPMCYRYMGVYWRFHSSQFESVGTAKNKAEDNNWLTKVSSSAAGLGNKMKLKFRLAPLSLICISRQRAFCFWFCNLPSWVTAAIRWQYWLGIQGCSKSHFWTVQVQNNHYHSWKKHACWILFTDKVLLVARHRGKSVETNVTL